MKIQLLALLASLFSLSLNATPKKAVLFVVDHAHRVFTVVSQSGKTGLVPFDFNDLDRIEFSFHPAKFREASDQFGTYRFLKRPGAPGMKLVSFQSFGGTEQRLISDGSQLFGHEDIQYFSPLADGNGLVLIDSLGRAVRIRVDSTKSNLTGPRVIEEKAMQIDRSLRPFVAEQIGEVGTLDVIAYSKPTVTFYRLNFNAGWIYYHSVGIPDVFTPGEDVRLFSSRDPRAFDELARAITCKDHLVRFTPL